MRRIGDGFYKKNEVKYEKIAKFEQSGRLPTPTPMDIELKYRTS